MVVAAGAADGETEEPAGEDVDSVVDDVGRDAEETPTGREEPERGEVGIPFATDPIGGKLEGHEAIVGEIVVEGPDHPVAVHRGMNEKPLLAAVDIALGVGIAGDVEPVPPLLLPVSWRREEPIDEFFIGVGGGIGDEGCHLPRLRRQSGQVVTDAADERPPIRFGSAGEPRPGEGRVDEPIDERRLERACRRLRERLKGPVVFLLFDHRRPSRRRLGPGGPGHDPGLDRPDLFCGEPSPRLRRRHPHFFIGMAETEEKLRLVGTAGQESRAGVTAREEPRAGVEP